MYKLLDVRRYILSGSEFRSRHRQVSALSLQVFPFPDFRHFHLYVFSFSVPLQSTSTFFYPNLKLLTRATGILVCLGTDFLCKIDGVNVTSMEVSMF